MRGILRGQEVAEGSLHFWKNSTFSVRASSSSLLMLYPLSIRLFLGRTEAGRRFHHLRQLVGGEALANHGQSAVFEEKLLSRVASSGMCGYVLAAGPPSGAWAADFREIAMAPTTITLSLVILLPVLTVPLVLALASRLGPRVGYLTAVAPLGSAGLLAWIAASAGSQPRVILEIPWVPQLGVNLSFLIDGLSIFYGFVICAIGVLVCWYAAEYLGKKYAHARFYSCLLFFMSAMLGTVFPIIFSCFSFFGN